MKSINTDANINIPIKNKSGVYKIKCDNCAAFYIGQSGRDFYTRFLEHIPKTNNNNSSFAQHLITKGHNYTSFENNLVALHTCKKGKLMDSLEEFEIYKATKNATTKNNILNDQMNFGSNNLFDTAIRLNDNYNQS